MSSNRQSCEETSFDADESLGEVIEGREDLKIDGEFSLKTLTEHFLMSMSDPEVNLAAYLNGYREVYKFLSLLGTMFGWVGNDVLAKVVKLQKYLDDKDISENYQTVKGMIKYEVEKDMIEPKKKNDASGSRTLLRLHRALEYIILFLHQLDDIQDEDKCSDISRDAYDRTLIKHHPWVVQKAAKMAMGLLPTKGGLVLLVCPQGDEESIKQAREDFPKAVAAMAEAYDATQALFKANGLLDIP